MINNMNQQELDDQVQNETENADHEGIEKDLSPQEVKTENSQ